MNGRVTEFGISGVGEFAAGDQFVTERAFGTEGELIFGGFSVDEEAGAAGRCSHSFGADAVSFFANDKKKCQIAGAGREQRFGGSDHGCSNTLGIARTATPDGVGIFTRGEERRDRIDVSGESDDGRVEGKKEIVAAGRRGDALEVTGKTGGQSSEVRGEEIANLAFGFRGRVDVHEGARK